MNMYSSVVVFEDVPAYDSLTKWILGGLIASTFIAGIVLLAFDVTGAVIMFAATLLDALVIRAVLPKRFEVYEDRLKIVLPAPFSLTIPFRDIIRVREASKDTAWVYWGIRFSTSSNYLVEIERKNGMNVILSPSMEDRFIEQLEQVRSGWKEPGIF